jgi:GDP-L-fucose synthase
MVGGAICRVLASRDLEVLTRSRDELDLTDQASERAYLNVEKPDAVILAAAKVGGIHANNSYPAELIYENLMMECGVIHQAFKFGVRRILFLGRPAYAQTLLGPTHLWQGLLLDYRMQDHRRHHHG